MDKDTKKLLKLLLEEEKGSLLIFTMMEEDQDLDIEF